MSGPYREQRGDFWTQDCRNAAIPAFTSESQSGKTHQQFSPWCFSSSVAICIFLWCSTVHIRDPWSNLYDSMVLCKTMEKPLSCLWAKCFFFFLQKHYLSSWQKHREDMEGCSWRGNEEHHTLPDNMLPWLMITGEEKSVYQVYARLCYCSCPPGELLQYLLTPFKELV